MAWRSPVGARGRDGTRPARVAAALRRFAHFCVNWQPASAASHKVVSLSTTTPQNCVLAGRPTVPRCSRSGHSARRSRARRPRCGAPARDRWPPARRRLGLIPSVDVTPVRNRAITHGGADVRQPVELAPGSSPTRPRFAQRTSPLTASWRDWSGATAVHGHLIRRGRV